MKVMLDTNICIYIIKRRPQSVLQRFSAFPVGDIGISAITLAELEYGAALHAGIVLPAIAEHESRSRTLYSNSNLLTTVFLRAYLLSRPTLYGNRGGSR